MTTKLITYTPFNCQSSQTRLEDSFLKHHNNTNQRIYPHPLLSTNLKHSTATLTICYFMNLCATYFGLPLLEPNTPLPSPPPLPCGHPKYSIHKMYQRIYMCQCVSIYKFVCIIVICFAVWNIVNQYQDIVVSEPIPTLFTRH